MVPLIPIQQAVLDAYAAACAEVPRDLRRFVILIGGAASIAQGMRERLTGDADIIVNAAALSLLDDAANQGRGGFRKDTDGTVLWDRLGEDGKYKFSVSVDYILLNGPFAPRVPDVVGFGNGFVATLPELVRLRAVAVVDRGKKRDYDDFRRLLSMTRQKGLKLPHIDEEELEVLTEAVELLEDEAFDRILMDILSI